MHTRREWGPPQPQDSYGEFRRVRGLVAPYVPSQAMTAREQLNVWARTNLLDHVEEVLRLAAVTTWPHPRPVEPCRVHAPQPPQRPDSADEAVFSRLCPRAARP